MKVDIEYSPDDFGWIIVLNIEKTFTSAFRKVVKKERQKYTQLVPKRLFDWRSNDFYDATVITVVVFATKNEAINKAKEIGFDINE